MATITNDPNPRPDRVVEVEHDSSAGWAIAIILLIAIIVGLFVWMHYHGSAVRSGASGGTNVNVTVPSIGGGISGSSGGGGTSGGTGQ